MPELPEVQTMVSDLNKKILRRKIKSVWFDFPKSIKKVKPAYFRKKVEGRKILSVKRKAKNVLFGLSGGYLLAIHPKMTGRFLYGDFSKKRDRHVHLILSFSGGGELAFSDVRKFGRILFGPEKKIINLAELKNIGPDPLDKTFTFKKFEELIKDRKGKIKALLMNQEIIGGIGNIYSDEILYSAKINPFAPADRLTPVELGRIYASVKKILMKAVRLRGSSISDFLDLDGQKGLYAQQRLAYGRAGQPCRRCQTAIKKAKIFSRSTHYCPKCQAKA